MSTKRSKSRKLRVADFAGEGEPYSEVNVNISIRVLGNGITRSRMAVSITPDAALAGMARDRMKIRESENYGYDEHGNFVVCLGNDFNGYEDLSDDYPRIDVRGTDNFQTECLQRMNAYIRDSVDWALSINREGMRAALENEPKKKLSRTSGGDLVM